MTSRKKEFDAGDSAIAQRKYATPKLVHFGSVAELTQGGAGSVQEVAVGVGARRHP